jgi:hypothetical protein
VRRTWRRSAAIGLMVALSLNILPTRVVVPVTGPGLAEAATPPNSNAVSAPADLHMRLPWKAGDTHVLGDYRYNQRNASGDFIGSDHACGSDTETQDCYALDVVDGGPMPFTTGTEIYPLFGGTVVYAGWATGGWACYGQMVYIEQTIGSAVYGALYAHLSNLTTSTGHRTTVGDVVGPGGAIGLNDPIGKAGGSASTGCQMKDDQGRIIKTATAPTLDFWSTHLHFAVYQNAKRTADGLPKGGKAVVPEPLLGVGVYEDFAWFGGPMTAVNLAAPASPGPSGAWAAGATPGNASLVYGSPVVWNATVTSGAPIAKVQLTVRYAGWSDLSPFSDGGIWRIVCAIDPGASSASAASCPGGTWTGSSTSATVHFSWDPWHDAGTAVVPWMPNAIPPPRPTRDHKINLCISFDVYASSGARSLAPGSVSCSTVASQGAVAAADAGNAPRLVTLVGDTSPGPANCTESGQFLYENPQDTDVFSAGQAFTKSWTWKNTGTCTWAGYTVQFMSGNRMNAPSSVSVPTTAPGQAVTIQIPMTATAQGGARGDWQLFDDQGVAVPYANMWVIATIASGGGGGGSAGSGTTIGPTYPGVVSPGQQFGFSFGVTIDSGQLLASRGDMIRNKDENLFGAFPHIAVVGTVNAGTLYTFTSYPDHPMIAPSAEGTYTSTWQLWQNGNWAGPELVMTFQVKNGGGSKPAKPTPTSPDNWAVSRDGSTPALCVQAQSGVEYDIQIFQGAQTPDSGWISNNCWTPPTLGPYTFSWHAKVRANGIESDWSDTRSFSIDSQVLSLDDFKFATSPVYDPADVRLYTCVRGYGQINVGLSLYANTANDGSASGEWKFISPKGAICYDTNDPSTWPEWETREWGDGPHLVEAIGYHGQETVTKTTVYTLPHRRPSDPHPVTPEPDGWSNSRTVTFSWTPALRATSYQLLIGLADPPSAANALVNVTLPGSTTSYTATFGSSYPQLHTLLIANGDLGTGSAGWPFGIDTQAPVAAVTALPASESDTQFTVSWSGSDDASNVRWYDVQYRDGNRPDSTWTDWKTATTDIAAIFAGQPGHSYYFRARALDVAGNLGTYAAGDGDQHTLIDLASVPSTPWWNTAYAAKRSIVILNNDAHAIPSGYPIKLHFDAGTSPTAAELYAESAATPKGADVRVVYQDTTELPRYVQNLTSTSIDIWFDLSASIGGSPTTDSTDYQIYVGNPSASMPATTIGDVLPESNESGTVGNWHLNEGSGTAIADSSGNGYSGTANNVSWIQGKFGPAIQTIDNSSGVYLGTSSAFNPPIMTVEAWVYPTRTNGECSILWKNANDGALLFDFLMQEDGFYLRLNGNNGFAHSSARPVLNTWQHVAATYDGTTIKVYVNGVLSGSTAYSVPLRPATSTEMWLGRKPTCSNCEFPGAIQDVRFSNVVRSSFPSAAFAIVTSEPSAAAGSSQSQPVPGSPSLSVDGVTVSVDSQGNTILTATVGNHGETDTRNGFTTDLYLDHQPTGPGDYTGSTFSWTASSVDSDGSVVLATALAGPAAPSASGQARPMAAGANETSHTAYVQADSGGSLASFDDPSKTISGPIQVCIASADSYEPDDTPATATAQAVGATTHHNASKAGDVDWVRLSLAAGIAYDFNTSGLGSNADTVLTLYASDGTTVLAQNDDTGLTLASDVAWTPATSGTYYLQVQQWSTPIAGCGTSYDLSVFSGAATGLSVYGLSSPRTAGTSGAITVKALDAHGGTATGYTGTVHFTSSDPVAILPGDYTFTIGDAGVHSFSVTLETVGTQSVTATDTATASITGSQTGISVVSTPGVPGAPTAVHATAGNAQATVSWSAPASNGGSPITGYTVTSSPGGKTCTTTGALTCEVSGLTNGTSYTFTVKATNSIGPGTTSAASNSVTPTAAPPATSTYHPITPVRLLDTRYANGHSGKITTGTPMTFAITGRTDAGNPVPSGASAVTGNLTVTESTAGWAIYLGPTPIASPGSSTINFTAGQTIANGLTVALSSSGTLSATYLGPAGAKTSLVFDVTGYYTPDATGQTFHPIAPIRDVDTRIPKGLAGKLTAKVPACFTVAGVGTVPAEAKAVTGNVTVTNSTSAWALYLGPLNTATPTTSTLNFLTGQVASNNVTVALDGSGKLCATYLGPTGATTHLVFDVTGYFTDDATGAAFVPIDPVRLLDTRHANGLTGKFTVGTPRTFTVTGRSDVGNPVPADATAVTGNLTVTDESAGWAIYIGPDPLTSPPASSLNFVLGDVKANGVSVALSSSGTLSPTYLGPAGATTSLVFDCTGYFVLPAP